MPYHDPEEAAARLSRGVRLPDGSVLLSAEEVVAMMMDAAVDEIEELVAERDRARLLAAKLEEVVAARTAVLEDFLGCYDNGFGNSVHMDHVAKWARAQLEEIP